MELDTLLIFLITLAGLPAAMLSAGISEVTMLPAPIIDLAPISIVR